MTDGHLISLRNTPNAFHPNQFEITISGCCISLNREFDRRFVSALCIPVSFERLGWLNPCRHPILCSINISTRADVSKHKVCGKMNGIPLHVFLLLRSQKAHHKFHQIGSNHSIESYFPFLCDSICTHLP